mmetsp:Transcript_17825/g.34841  ORF Transcript_17825/g.34841 Transcript_17825/m.34841 type:complete len:354 (-) Transcript_17825:182-1243(-)
MSRAGRMPGGTTPSPLSAARVKRNKAIKRHIQGLAEALADDSFGGRSQFALFAVLEERVIIRGDTRTIALISEGQGPLGPIMEHLDAPHALDNFKSIGHVFWDGSVEAFRTLVLHGLGYEAGADKAGILLESCANGQAPPQFIEWNLPPHARFGPTTYKVEWRPFLDKPTRSWGKSAAFAVAVATLMQFHEGHFDSSTAARNLTPHMGRLLHQAAMKTFASRIALSPRDQSAIMTGLLFPMWVPTVELRELCLGRLSAAQEKVWVPASSAWLCPRCQWLCGGPGKGNVVAEGSELEVEGGSGGAHHPEAHSQAHSESNLTAEQRAALPAFLRHWNTKHLSFCDWAHIGHTHDF